MTQMLPTQEYRILLRRTAQAGRGFADQFTAIVAAREPEHVIDEAEKLIELLGGNFTVVDIQPVESKGD